MRWRGPSGKRVHLSGSPEVVAIHRFLFIFHFILVANMLTTSTICAKARSAQQRAPRFCITMQSLTSSLPPHLPIPPPFASTATPRKSIAHDCAVALLCSVHHTTTTNRPPADCVISVLVACSQSASKRLTLYARRVPTCSPPAPDVASGIEHRKHAPPPGSPPLPQMSPKRQRNP